MPEPLRLPPLHRAIGSNRLTTTVAKNHSPKRSSDVAVSGGDTGVCERPGTRMDDRSGSRCGVSHRRLGMHGDAAKVPTRVRWPDVGNALKVSAKKGFRPHQQRSRAQPAAFTATMILTLSCSGSKPLQSFTVFLV